MSNLHGRCMRTSTIRQRAANFASSRPIELWPASRIHAHRSEHMIIRSESSDQKLPEPNHAFPANNPNFKRASCTGCRDHRPEARLRENDRLDWTSRCSMNSRRLDSKADSTCTASDVETPVARGSAIRLFCSATIFCASHTRRWARTRGSSSASMLPRGAGEVRWRRVWKLDRLTLEVREAAQGSES